VGKGKGKTTSAAVARVAGKLLANPHTSKPVKRVAASDLAQHEHSGRKRK
jgi:hypothetical protein